MSPAPPLDLSSAYPTPRVIENDFQNQIMMEIDIRMINEAVMKEFIAVAELAKRCLELIGRERPTMKEVAAVLEHIRSIKPFHKETHPML
ncbi:hypothetical protein HHK36_019452 [Tetracentron sinense]|uniref:Uncharacterized protein n=1 Tax=Tetracentron sinense TaxID=13715 RepID=A0A834YXJ1_TETSI|nr:hypothetical protein HHK36_019452 [Tetracentron sinense]